MRLYSSNRARFQTARPIRLGRVVSLQTLNGFITRIALLAALPLLLSSCGLRVSQPEMNYYFSHPLLNEQWKPRHFQGGKARRVADKGKTSRKKKSRRKTASGRKNTKKLLATPAQELRGNDMDVVRLEMVLAARRLLGVGETFTQDSFIRHLLVVNNLGVGRVPEQGTVKFLFEELGGREVGTVKAGDILFLGDGGPEQCVIAEQVDSDGTVAFIGYVGGRVSRGVLSLSQAAVRRDEKSKKVLNSFVDKTTLAGSLLLGAYTLESHEKMLAGKNSTGGHQQ